MNAHHAALRTPALLAALLALLTGCATAPDAIPGKRHSTQELLSYQPGDFRWQPTRASAEEAARERDLSLLRQRLSLAPGSAEAQAALPEILAAVLHYNTEIDAARAPALSGLTGLETKPAEVQRAVLSAVYRFYAAEASAQLWALLPKLSGPREFAIAANALLKPLTGPARQSAAAQIKAQMQLSFPTTWADEPRLRALSWPLDQALQPSAPNAAPPLAELLGAPLRPGYPVVFSLQRPGREVLGLALLRGADGRFVREADGRLFQVPQLARA
ncbi:MAG: hypothetical protein K2W93_06915, partial [Burkholderiaceae bacterium]|nr:hypothetical protein [Burkholderiaceae bacterium]